MCRLEILIDKQVFHEPGRQMSFRFKSKFEFRIDLEYKLCLPYVPISPSAPWPLGATYVPILLLEGERACTVYASMNPHVIFGRNTIPLRFRPNSLSTNFDQNFVDQKFSTSFPLCHSQFLERCIANLMSLETRCFKTLSAP